MATSIASPTRSSRFGIPPAFGRLVWKEFRSLRAIWITLAVIAVFWQMLVKALGLPFPAQIGMFAMPAMFAMGAAVLLFAWETEERTLILLRIYPIRPGLLFLAKVGLGLFGTLLLALFIGMMAFAPQWIQVGSTIFATQPISMLFEFWLLWSSIAIGALAWGIFYSLLIGRVLPTLLLAPITMLLTAGLPYPYAWLAAACAADWWLAGRWLSDTMPSWPAFLTRRRARSLPHRFLLISDSASPRKVAFARLVWLEWQNARSFVLLALGVGVVAICVGSLRWFELFNAPLAFLVAVPTLMGAWTFAGEQHQRRFRLPAQRGLAAETVWLSKQVVWLSCTFATCVLLLLFDHFFHVLADSWWPGLYIRASCWNNIAAISHSTRELLNPLELWDSSRIVADLCLWITLGYGGGQFLSLLLSRAISAAIVSLPLVSMCALWWVAMAAFGIPLSWTVAPIPLVLLVATFIRAPDWLLERTGWRRWLKLAAVVVVPMLAVLTGVIVFRVTEIPKVDVPKPSMPNLLTIANLQPRSNSLSSFESVSLFNPRQSHWPDLPARQLHSVNRQDPVLEFLLKIKQGMATLLPTDRRESRTERKPTDLFDGESSDRGRETRTAVKKRSPREAQATSGARTVEGMISGLLPLENLLRSLENLVDFALRLHLRQLRDHDEEYLKLLYARIDDDWELERILRKANADRSAGAAVTPENEGALLDLLRARLGQATNLTDAGRLDEAFRKYLVLFHVSRQFAQVGGSHAWNIAQHFEEQTFESLQRWLAHPQQTSRRIRIAMVRVQDELAQWPVLNERVLQDHQQQRARFEEDWSLPAVELRARYERSNSFDVESLLWVRLFAPWEKWRILRLYDATAIAAEQDVVELQQLLIDSRADLGEWLLNRRIGEARASLRQIEAHNPGDQRMFRELTYIQPAPWRWGATTCEPPGSSLSVFYSHEQHLAQLEQFVTREARRRGWLLVMALVGWKLEHGTLPERLDELASTYFTVVPPDPWTGRNFGYRRDGFPLRAEFGGDRVEAGRPLIWSAGPEGREPIRSLGGPRGDAIEQVYTLGPRGHFFRTLPGARPLATNQKRVHTIP